MKKRLLALLLALTMAAALTACGGKQAPAEDAEPEEDIETAEPEGADAGDGATVGEVVDLDGLETEEPAPEIGSRPFDPEEKTEDGNLPADTTQKPEAQPVQKPEELPAQGPEESAAPAVDLTAFYETLTADGDVWPAMMQAEGEVLDAFYPGLSDVAVNQCGVYTAMISAAVGEIALVEVRDAGDVQRVKDIFQARIDYQVGDGENPGGAWYPQSIEGWKSGSRIVSNGNFVMLVALSEGADGAVESFNALFA